VTGGGYILLCRLYRPGTLNRAKAEHYARWRKLLDVEGIGTAASAHRCVPELHP
jgi:hypothetical protein